jgi:hypothetical protein
LIRNNFYKLKLYEKNEYFKLIKLNNHPYKKSLNKTKFYIPKVFKILYDIFNNELKFKGRVIIAGGSLLSDKILNDIDIFLTNFEENEGNRIIKELFYLKTKNGKIFIKSISENCYTYNLIINETVYETQIILRSYKCPAEVIYGFDVDCCSFLFDGKNYYGTERALYALNNKINHFDCDRMSNSYIFR